MYSDDFKVGGTLIWYYFICKREVWLIAHQITPDQDDTNVVLGRFYSEQTYNRYKKEVTFGHMKFDILKKDKHGLIVGEVKKSSRFKQSAKMQLAHYLYELNNKGIVARGELLFPQEKRKVVVELTDNIINELEQAKKDITAIVHQPTPPKAERNKFCKKCAYTELCWA